jgi:hypothetical protein
MKTLSNAVIFNKNRVEIKAFFYCDATLFRVINFYKVIN